ncbi:MAG: hypothetical protein KF696_14750 [Planctomycetes bacterium]|nr:hypothetical protein [Planctomycetota bacterium]MCW8137123.1 hypothetical protein [Planctomycetota bacterium]
MRKVISGVAVAAVTLLLAGSLPHAQKMDDPNPDRRAEAVDLAANQNNKVAATAIMAALATENDGPAGFRMADSVAKLTSSEALDVVEKSVLGFTKPENLFGAYWAFIGLSAQNSERASSIIRKAVLETKEKDWYVRTAAIEALAYTGRADQADLLLHALKPLGALDAKKLDYEYSILTLTCVHGAPKLLKGADKQMILDCVMAMADVLAASKDDRIQWFTCKSLAEITGEDTYIDPEFWRWWVKMGGKKGQAQHDGATVAGRDVPKFFKAAAVGKRVVFVIDISGSMQHPVELPPEMRNPPPPPKKEEKGPVTGKGSGKGGKDGEEEKKEEIPPPDYSKVKSKLDLAKVELIHTLRYLPEDYWFNIVIYHTPHAMIDNARSEFVQATKANKDLFIKKVDQLNWAALTNIHGALVRGFCVNSKKTIDPMKIGKSANNPAWDPDCLMGGATTMFFLTDGSPTISDDSTDIGQVGRAGGPMIGNGRFCKPDNIVLDVKRLNTFRKVVINTVGIGPHDGRLMAALAQLTGGEYIDRSGAARRGD